MSEQFEFLGSLPKELIAKVIKYLLEPETLFRVETIELEESDVQSKSIILNFVVCTRIQHLEIDNTYSCNQTVIKYNINFMNVISDMKKIESFIHKLEQNQTATLRWDSSAYSPTSHLNVITYINDDDSSYPRLVSEIYQMSYSQYYPPTPELAYNIDSKIGKFKSTSHSIKIKPREVKELIKKMNEIKELVIKHG